MCFVALCRALAWPLGFKGIKGHLKLVQLYSFVYMIVFVYMQMNVYVLIDRYIFVCPPPRNIKGEHIKLGKKTSSCKSSVGGGNPWFSSRADMVCPQVRESRWRLPPKKVG